MNVIALNVCHAGPDRASAVAAAILAADADIALLTEFRVGKGGDRLLNALAVGSLTEIIAGPPAAGAFPYTVAVASRLAVEAADYPLRKSPLQMASKVKNPTRTRITPTATPGTAAARRSRRRSRCARTGVANEGDDPQFTIGTRGTADARRS